MEFCRAYLENWHDLEPVDASSSPFYAGKAGTELKIDTWILLWIICHWCFFQLFSSSTVVLYNCRDIYHVIRWRTIARRGNRLCETRKGIRFHVFPDSYRSLGFFDECADQGTQSEWLLGHKSVRNCHQLSFFAEQDFGHRTSKRFWKLSRAQSSSYMWYLLATWDPDIFKSIISGL